MTDNSAEALTLSVVVPCYNEADNVQATLKSIAKAIELAPIPYEVIVVDDASLDNTLEVAQAAARTDFRIRVVANVVNRGLGGAYKAGCAQAANAYLILVPGDNGFPSASIARTLSRIGTADIVIPYVTNTSARGFLRGGLHYSFTALLNFLFWISVKYYNGPVVHKLSYSGQSKSAPTVSRTKPRRS